MSAPTPIVIVARWELASRAVDEVLALVAELRVKSLAEPGCLGYEVYQGAEPQSILLVERYLDQAALEAHRQSAHYQALVVQRVLPLLSARRVDILQARETA